MKIRIAIMASGALCAAASQAQTTPVERETTAPPTIRKPVLQPDALPTKPVVTAPVKVQPRATVRARTATANTDVRPALKPGIRFMDYDNPARGDYQIRYIIPGVADARNVELIVERKGKCGWTTSSFDGSPDPTTADRYVACRLDFARYRDAVAALADEPPASPDYYALVVDKYDRATEDYSDFMAQPVLAVLRGPGARVVRMTLNAVPVQAAAATASRIDRDGDGFEPISAGGTDCDDNDANRFPGNTEIPNQADEDCDPNTIGTLDRDGDGFTDWHVSNPVFGNRSRPLTGEDCDDSDRTTHPNSPEKPGDGKDNNCDGDDF